MIDGTYVLNMSTPLGAKSGKLILKEENGILTGSFQALGYENPIKNGRVNGNDMEFEGTIKTPFGSLDYSAKGKVVENNLQIHADSKFGSLDIVGIRA